MKKKLYFLLIVLFALSFSAQAQKFGDDVLIHECAGNFWAKPKISVADNGWIYVLMNKYGHPSENDETRIYRSTDGGVTFDQILYSVTPLGWKQSGRDIVVTGDNPSNMNLWFVRAENETATQKTYIVLMKMDANGQNGTVAYSFTYTNTTTIDIAMSTNVRSPEDDWSPFVIGFALTTYTIDADRCNVDYCYSTDGGANFQKKWIYNKVGSEFGSIDLSIGQATADLYYPFVGIVFEMDKESEKNIGFIAGRADGLNSTTALQVNKKHSSTEKTKQPKIQWLCNNTLNEPYNFMIVYSNYYNNIDWDIIKIYPTDDYNISFHTLDNLSWKYAAANFGIDEDYADLSYDKQYNNYLLVYRKSNDNNYTLQYKVQSYTNLASNTWTNIGEVSSAPENSKFFSSVVDIDPTRARACFAFERYSWESSPIVTQLLFDSEWSNTGVEEVVMDGELKVFPNPATNNITLRMNEEGVYLVRMYNMLGAEVAALQFSGTELTHDITGLPAGMYLIKLNTEKGTEFTTKIIVK
ncbi:MAG TPA: T9SS type A sorting domain-containing protein [Bacteroidales bacterium]|nr:T9SS type A sorting domain-containing protein [Bacteroidales bacterium]HPZ04134.1 T9SS type A sorting domain-containing protein [Bacteroidales bacterium]HQB75200.1 T9SS type A sorting domain-containing protein [Bacteroidales bacterium]